MQTRDVRLPWWARAAEAQVGHYRVRTDLPAADANALSRHLNIMHDEFSRRLAALPARAPTPMTVMLFAREPDYLETLQIRHNVDAVGSGGMFFVRPSISALAVWVGDLPRRRVLHVLQHEGFHQFAYSRFGTDLPLWVDEGLAELFGQAVVTGREVIIGQASARAVESVKNLIEADAHVPFREMLAMTPQRWSDAVAAGKAAALYHQAWSMVHFLAYGDGGRYAPRFERYLSLLNSGFLSQEAFVRAFETDDLEAFEKRWKQHAMRARPDGFITALHRIEFMAEGALELSREEVAPADSLDGLREALQAHGFVQKLSSHGLDERLWASDAMFTIPWDGNPDFQREPVFVVSPARPFQTTLRERRLAEIRPTPPTIETKWLSPRDLVVRWTRDLDTNTFTYDIEIRPPDR